MIENNSINSMRNRLGIKEIPNKKSSTIEGINDLSKRLHFAGGFPQQDRMILDKKRSLDKALKYSYQSAFVRKYIPNYIETMDNEKNPIVRALINPNKLKQDYDDKIISINYEDEYKIGDIFEWMNTGTYWLIYLQDLTELAYFRGDIRKCSYQISWKENDKICSTYAAVRGPVETKINYIQKHDTSIDIPNHSLSIIMPNNKYIEEQFKRYSKFYLNNSNICWRVEATDSVSVPGILEIIAVEYYSNKFEDNIQNGISGDLIIKPIDPNSSEINNLIKGDTFIKPRKTYEYEFIGNYDGQWNVDKKGVELKINDKKVQIKWLSNYSGQFNLTYGDYSKTIVVESLF